MGEMMSKEKKPIYDKKGNVIGEFYPKRQKQRYKIFDGSPKGFFPKGVTTPLSGKFGVGGLLWWSENSVYEAIEDVLEYELKKPVDERRDIFDRVKRKTKEIKDRAKNIGTDMHELAELYVLKKEYVEPISEPLKTMFSKFKDFWKTTDFEIIASEQSFYSPKLNTCGTVDLIVKGKKGIYKDKYGIIDFKTSKDFYPDMPVQVSAYKALIEESTNYKIEFLAVVKIPKENSVKVSMQPFTIKEEYLTAFKYCKFLDQISDQFKERKQQIENQLANKKIKGEHNV
tara:strand:+ start:57 stop:911 length:855 start_codon:yes stop_codon:yes gene_type:complete